MAIHLLSTNIIEKGVNVGYLIENPNTFALSIVGVYNACKSLKAQSFLDTPTKPRAFTSYKVHYVKWNGIGNDYKHLQHIGGGI